MVAKSVKQARLLDTAPVAGSDICLVVAGTHMQLIRSLMTTSLCPSHHRSARTRRQQSPAHAHLSATHNAAYNRAGIGYSQIVHVLASGVTHQEAGPQKDRNAFFSHSTAPEATPYQADLKSHGAHYISNNTKMTLDAKGGHLAFSQAMTPRTFC